MALVLTPKINFLKCLMPLNTAEKWIKLTVGVVKIYLLLCLLEFIGKKFIERINNKPKNVLLMFKDYSEYISVFLSRNNRKYCLKVVNLQKYNIPNDIIYELLDNNIIEKNPFEHSEYRLNKRACKKLNRILKLATIIFGGKQK